MFCTVSHTVWLLLFARAISGFLVHQISPLSEKSAVSVKVKVNHQIATENDPVFVLCTGDNSDLVAVQNLEIIGKEQLQGDAAWQNDTLLGKSDSNQKNNHSYYYSLEVPDNSGANGVYLIQMFGTDAHGSDIIEFSDRFYVDRFVGQLPAMGSINEPAPAMMVEKRDDATTTSITLPADYTNSFTVPYNKQSGSVKYAPMQTQPGTSAATGTWSRQYPTSEVTYYKTYRTTVDALSTVTPGWSYTRKSAVNFATAAPGPEKQGSWYAPSIKLEKPTYMGTSTSTS